MCLIFSCGWMVLFCCCLWVGYVFVLGCIGWVYTVFGYEWFIVRFLVLFVAVGFCFVGFCFTCGVVLVWVLIGWVLVVDCGGWCFGLVGWCCLFWVDLLF